jgi:hypothetical protein
MPPGIAIEEQGARATFGGGDQRARTRAATVSDDSTPATGEWLSDEASTSSLGTVMRAFRKPKTASATPASTEHRRCTALALER